MTRSHKYNDPHHGTQAEEAERLPKWFSKTGGFVDMDPKKTKKEGAGKANWGREGDELLDDETIRLTKPRRRSNSSVGDYAVNFKTKFEAIDPEPVFEEDVHGASEEDLAAAGLSPTTSHNTSRERPEGHDGFGFEDDKSTGESSTFSVNSEEDAIRKH